MTLNIYYARESIDKDRFIYENVGPGSIVIVPDQFSLQAERDALSYKNAEALMDIEILSFSRLKDRVFDETGGASIPMIDKQGRHMVLARIMAHMDGLELYGKYKQQSVFLEMMNNTISELKQYDITPEGLADAAEGAGPLLAEKMAEIGAIYEKYQEETSGHYIDTEDLAELFCAKIKDSRLIAESDIWIYGFDVFSPKNLKAIGEMIGRAKSVSVVITYDRGGKDEDLFAVGKETLEKLEVLAEERNIKPVETQIGPEYRKDQTPVMAHIEKNIYALPYEKSDLKDGIRLITADDPYSEAETAAAYVAGLVRDRGYRYSDILLICNDISERGQMCRRIFARHGIKLFVDEKRPITHTPLASFVTALGDMIVSHYHPADVMRLIRTGLTDLSREEADALDNYARRYAKARTSWKKPLTAGQKVFDEETFAALEEARRKAVEPAAAFHEEYKSTRSTREKADVLYGFLEAYGIPEKLEKLMAAQEEAGDDEAAAETAQVWDCVIGILDQMVEIMGDDMISQSDFALMLRAGIEAVEIGILPPAADGLMMGTMQRTRGPKVKALVILGANEGLIPMEPSLSGILTDEEKERIAKDKNIQISKPDRLRVAEENMAIYRNLSKPEEELYISCPASGTDGGAARPSRIFENLRGMFPNADVEYDIYRGGDLMDLVDSLQSTVLAAAEGIGGGQAPDDVWKEVWAWLSENEPSVKDKITEGMLFDGKVDKIEKDLIKRLYMKDKDIMKMSASRLEQYSRCPFAYFINYGLHADDERRFEIDSLEMGTVYHECLMRISRRLTKQGVPVTSDDSPWMTADRSEIEQLTKETVEDLMQSWRGDLFKQGKAEEYRAGRMKEICTESAWAMVRQVRLSRIKDMLCEVSFGSGKTLKPLVLQTENGEVLIEGKIDRLDTSGEGYAKVIDYKSSARSLKKDRMKAGWDIQLMLYIKAAEESGYVPAGTFYYHIHDPEIKLEGDDDGSDVTEKIVKDHRLNGLMVKDIGAVRFIDDAVGNGEKSTVAAGLGLNKDGNISKNDSRLMSPEDFEELEREVKSTATKLAGEILGGEIGVKPKRLKDETACRYCQYKGICKFDLAFAENRYENI